MSVNFPTLGAYQGLLSANADVFISKMDEAGGLLWSTYYGGLDFDNSAGIATDKSTGDIYVAGYTFSPLFPIGALPGQTSFMNIYPVGSTNAAFLLKFNSAGIRVRPPA